MKRKKILHIITGLEVGGAETNLSRIVPALEVDFENRILCLIGHGPMAKKFEKKNIPLYYLDIKSVLDFINPKKLWQFRKIVKEFCPDVIETYLIHSDIFGRIWGRFFSVKKIICNHRGSLLQWEWLLFIDRLTSFLVTKYVFQTPSAQKEISKKLKINIKETAVIPNVIDLGDFQLEIDKNQKIEELGIKKGNINILSVSNLRKGKGHQYLIEAFNNVYKKGYNNVNLVIVGDGDQRPILENQAGISHAKDNIFFLGRRSDVLPILAVSDIFVLPTFYEGMSNAIMEAMATGLAIITTDIDVNKDLVNHNYSGLLVPPGNSEKIEEYLIELINNEELKKKLGTNAKCETKEKYSLPVITQKISTLINEVLEY